MADFTLSDMPDTLCRVDTADDPFVVDAGTNHFGSLASRSGGSVYVKGPLVTFSVFDPASSTFKTIEIPSITSLYGVGQPPDLCRIVTLPVVGTRAIIWHAGTIGIYAAGPPGWATPNAARRVPLVRSANSSGLYLNGGALFVPNAGAGAGDCNINPFPIVPYIGTGTGSDSGFATWANMPWFDATWMFADPTGGDVGGLPYPYSISPWVEAGYGDEYQGSIPSSMLTFTQPSATDPTIDVQDLAAAIPFGFHIPAITVTVPSASSTSGLVLVGDPAIFGTPDYFANVECHVEIWVPGAAEPEITDSFPLAGLTSGSDVVKQYLPAGHGTFLVSAYYTFGFGVVVMFYRRDVFTSVTIP